MALELPDLPQPQLHPDWKSWADRLLVTLQPYREAISTGVSSAGGVSGPSLMQALMALGIADIGNVWQSFEELFVDHFDTTEMVDVSGAVNLSTAVAGELRPTQAAAGDLATTLNVISGGDVGGSFTKTAAVDNNGATEWASSQLGAAVNGAAYIGVDFGSSPRHIRQATLVQGNTVTTNGRVTSVKVQSAPLQAGPWTDIGTFAVPNSTALQTLNLPATGPERCWRILANTATVAGNGWFVAEVQFIAVVDQATTAGASSSGAGGGSTAAQAFDDNGATSWQSSVVGPGVPGVAYVANDLGSAKEIRVFSVQQGYTDANGRINSAKLQYADAVGGPWTDVVTVTLATTGVKETFSAPATGPHRYWAVRANGAPGGGAAWAWFIAEVEFFEAAQVDDLTVRSQVLPADDVPRSVNLYALVKPIDVLDVPGDLIFEFSRDNGTSWTEIPMDVAYTLGDAYVLESTTVNLTAQPEDDLPAWRLRSFDKMFGLQGIGVWQS